MKRSIFWPLLGLLLMICQSGLAQKRIDTVFLNKEYSELSTIEQYEFIAYELRAINKKGVINGKVFRYDKEDKLLGYTEYQKGKPNGEYHMLNPQNGITIKGQFTKGVKSGFWVGMRRDESLVYIHQYVDGVLKVVEQWEESQAGVEISEPPSFKGGPRGWTEFLRANLKYPTAAKARKIQGRVEVKFIVLADGTVLIPRVVSSPNPSLSAEALRVMKRSPKWIPAKVNSTPVVQEMQIQIEFRLNSF